MSKLKKEKDLLGHEPSWGLVTIKESNSANNIKRRYLAETILHLSDHHSNKSTHYCIEFVIPSKSRDWRLRFLPYIRPLASAPKYMITPKVLPAKYPPIKD